MAYATIADLLIGDLPISDLIDQQTFVDDAADEIDAALGGAYTVPIVTVGLPRYATALLKKINAHLATGRLIATVAIGAEDSSVHAYAKSMIDEAKGLLMQIAAGQIKLPGAVLSTVDTSLDTSVRVKNLDAVSAVEAFNGFVHSPYGNQTSPRWAPGATG